jgi:hypothetical protein
MANDRANSKPEERPLFCPMRWLMIAMYLSVAVLLVISTAAARYIWREHKRRPAAQTALELEPRTEEAETSTEESQ